MLAEKQVSNSSSIYTLCYNPLSSIHSKISYYNFLENNGRFPIFYSVTRSDCHSRYQPLTTDTRFNRKKLSVLINSKKMSFFDRLPIESIQQQTTTKSEVNRYNLGNFKALVPLI